MPAAASASNPQSRMRLPCTWAKHLGVSAVVGISRRPRPAPIIIARTAGLFTPMNGLSNSIHFPRTWLVWSSAFRRLALFGPAEAGTPSLHEPSEAPPGFGVRQSCGALATEAVRKRQRARGLAHSKTLQCDPQIHDSNARSTTVEVFHKQAIVPAAAKAHPAQKSTAN